MTGGLRVAVLKERANGETRVAATPETVKKLTALGAVVAVESSAGAGAAIADADFAAAGAHIAAAAKVVDSSDIILCVQGPDPKLLKGVAPGAWIVGTLAPMAETKRIGAYAKAGFEALAMEFMPRITRAQSMDVLSSQSNLAGYLAVIASAKDRKSVV